MGMVAIQEDVSRPPSQWQFWMGNAFCLSKETRDLKMGFKVGAVDCVLSRIRYYGE